MGAGDPEFQMYYFPDGLCQAPALGAAEEIRGRIGWSKRLLRFGSWPIGLESAFASLAAADALVVRVVDLYRRNVSMVWGGQRRRKFGVRKEWGVPECLRVQGVLMDGVPEYCHESQPWPVSVG